MTSEFKTCTGCKHFNRRHALDNTCANFENSRDVITGWISYRHVRDVRADESMCGKSAKMWEPIDRTLTTKEKVLVAVAIACILVAGSIGIVR